MPAREAIVKVTVWLGKNPKALPLFVTWVNRKNPSEGTENPSVILILMRSFEN